MDTNKLLMEALKTIKQIRDLQDKQNKILTSFITKIKKNADNRKTD